MRERVRPRLTLGGGVYQLSRDPQFSRHLPLFRITDPETNMAALRLLSAALLRSSAGQTRRQLSATASGDPLAAGEFGALFKIQVALVDVTFGFHRFL